MSREQLQAAHLSKQCPVRFLASVLVDYAVIALAMAGGHAAFAAAQQSQFGSASNALDILAIGLAVFVIGTRQHAITILGHEGSHGRFSSNGRWNDIVTNLFCFWPFGMGLSGYRKFHFAHHRYLGTPSDPELFLKAKTPHVYETPTSPLRIVGTAAAALLGGAMTESTHVLNYIMSRSSRKDIIVPIAMWTTFALVLWHFDAWWIALMWFAALMTSYWAVFRLRVWTEHVGTSDTHRIEARWLYRLIFLPHNAWCHYEHHRFPTVPFWNLPKARPLDATTPVRSLESLFASYGPKNASLELPAAPVVQL